MRTRIFPESNYRSVFMNWKTIRIAIDKSKPILELSHPEFYDLKITNYCSGGCSYCYQNSVKEAHYENIVGKSLSLFEWMTDNEKPYQIAIGWWNPNEHPDFIELLETLDWLDIMPNYTSNWIWLTPEIIEATKLYCWGVAITCHPHLAEHWTEWVELLAKNWIRVNLHILISDKRSIDRMVKIYNKFKDKVDYLVLLPLMEMWRQKQEVKVDYPHLQSVYKNLDMSKIAFWANFYPYVKDDNLDISLYEPEIMSKYIDLKWEWAIYKSSFAEKPIRNLNLNNISYEK